MSGKKKYKISNKVVKKKLVFYILITSIFVGERPVALVHPFRTQYGRLSLRRWRAAEVAEEAVPARKLEIKLIS